LTKNNLLANTFQLKLFSKVDSTQFISANVKQFALSNESVHYHWGEARSDKSAARGLTLEGDQEGGTASR
jgi:hypothetical protein